LIEPSPPMNPGEADGAAAARAARILSQLSSKCSECVSVLAPGCRWSPRRLLEQARMHGNDLFQRYLGQRYAALASAVLLGQRESVDPEVTEAYVETGTIHLLI
jgi:predicted membrane metal-binding protein